MGDAQQQLQSQAAKVARVGRCGFGDGKEVGDTATGRASRLRRSLGGDSRSLAGDDDDDDPRSGGRGTKSEAQSVAPIEESVSQSMKPTTAESAEDSQHGVDYQENLTPPSEKVAALPKREHKSFSLELCGGSNHGVNCGQSERCLRNPRASDDRIDSDVVSKIRSDMDDSGVCPRRAFLLKENIVSLMDSPKKTSSLMSNLRQREGRKVSSSTAAESSGESKSYSPAMWRVEASEFEEKAKKTLSWTRIEDYGDRDGAERAGESRREKRHFAGSSAGIPELIEAFLEDGEIPSSEEDDGIMGAAKAKASIAGTGSEMEVLGPEDASQTLQQKQQQQSSQCLTPSLQSTCDVSSWSLCHYHSLPQWMQDNEFILSYHRPPLPSFFACFKSIFRLHSETLNIWTHLLGAVAFVAMGAYFLALPREAVWLQEKLAFGAFFGGGAACFALSSAYHTLWCHSPAVGRLFSKLDYCGIALLIMGSFIPWLYYAFYCRGRLLLAYLALVAALGALAVLVSLWGRFGEPRFRPLRAGVFLAYGLSGVVPALHFAAAEGWRRAVAQASLHWLALMGALYVLGACVYALRVPERFFPGRCDLLFQSHQIFHVFVIAAALVHYHGLTEMAVYRLSFTDCSSRSLA